jgi:2-keto-4-pentenoate hydratase/2-oxohepta-3-ene-1,7-dioic acid hydratase in catechol pathway
MRGVKTLVPVIPSKIIAVGLNYADHARESGKPLPQEPLFWLKAPTSLDTGRGKDRDPVRGSIGPITRRSWRS